MGLMKKLLWDASPVVIIGKKMQVSKRAKKGPESSRSDVQVEKPNKQEKRLSLGGLYYSSHPDIHGYDSLNLEFGEDGIDVVVKKSTIKAFTWSEIISFENQAEETSDLRTTQRVTATRMVAGGVFALAAPKSKTKGSIKGKFNYALHTTTGDIELEYSLSSGSGGGSFGDMNRSIIQMTIARQEAKANKIKRFVAEHASAKTPAAQTNPISSSAEELEKYAKLRDKGVITEEEFADQKAKLLNSVN